MTGPFAERKARVYEIQTLQRVYDVQADSRDEAFALHEGGEFGGEVIIDSKDKTAKRAHEAREKVDAEYARTAEELDRVGKENIPVFSLLASGEKLRPASQTPDEYARAHGKRQSGVQHDR